MAAKAATAEKVEFTYEGTNRGGTKVKGEIFALSDTLAKSELRKQGINPLKVKKKPKPLFGGAAKIQAADIAIFARQMATMMQAGVPLVQSFEIIGQGSEKQSVQKLILGIKNEVEGGVSLAEALAKEPLYFDPLFINLVNAGEQSGALETMLDKLATYKEKTEALKAKVKKALFYPVAVIVVAILVTAIIMIFVIPQFQELFSGFGADLPAPTQVVIGMSTFMQSWWWALLLGVAAVGSLANAAWKRSSKFREVVDRTLLKLPVIGVILHKAALARFARTTSTMFAAGVPLVEALESVAGATGSVVYGTAVLKMREDVATGQSLQLSMRQQTLFPHMVIQMVSIGEESGALDSMLSKVADFYEEEVDNAVDALSSLLEPLIMVVLGVMIGGMVVALYLPIFQLGNVISGNH